MTPIVVSSAAGINSRITLVRATASASFRGRRSGGRTTRSLDDRVVAGVRARVDMLRFAVDRLAVARSATGTHLLHEGAGRRGEPIPSFRVVAEHVPTGARRCEQHGARARRKGKRKLGGRLDGSRRMHRKHAVEDRRDLRR